MGKLARRPLLPRSPDPAQKVRRRPQIARWRPGRSAAGSSGSGRQIRLLGAARCSGPATSDHQDRIPVTTGRDEDRSTAPPRKQPTPSWPGSISEKAALVKEFSWYDLAWSPGTHEGSDGRDTVRAGGRVRRAPLDISVDRPANRMPRGPRWWASRHPHAARTSARDPRGCVAARPAARCSGAPRSREACRATTHTAPVQ